MSLTDILYLHTNRPEQCILIFLREFMTVIDGLNYTYLNGWWMNDSHDDCNQYMKNAVYIYIVIFKFRMQNEHQK